MRIVASWQTDSDWEANFLALWVSPAGAWGKWPNVAAVCRAGCVCEGALGYLTMHRNSLLAEEMVRQSLAPNTPAILDLYCLTPKVSLMAHLWKFSGRWDAQRVKCLLSRHENQSLDLQNPHKCQVGRVATYNSQGRDSEATWLGSLANLQALAFPERSCLKMYGGEQLRKTLVSTSCLLTHVPAHTCTHTHACVTQLILQNK